MSQKRGVYFLANDRVLDLTIAFLNSFRRHNPKTPLCLVPFDEHIARLQGLQSKYTFSVFRDPGHLEECDRLSIHFFGKTVGQFRKLAMWEGEFDEFVYIDVDTIVLASIDFGFDYLRKYDFVASHSNMTVIRKWVWKETIFKTGKLTDEQIKYSANTGFMISKLGALSLAEATNKVPDALLLWPYMVPPCAEQSFLNYLIVTSGKPYTSLSLIAANENRSDIPLERWGGGWLGWSYQGELSRSPDEPPTLLVHWAGEWRRECHKTNSLWHYYRNFEV